MAAASSSSSDCSTRSNRVKHIERKSRDASVDKKPRWRKGSCFPASQFVLTPPACEVESVLGAEIGKRIASLSDKVKVASSWELVASIWNACDVVVGRTAISQSLFP